jgi:hypothetical protein
MATPFRILLLNWEAFTSHQRQYTRLCTRIAQLGRRAWVGSLIRQIDRHDYWSQHEQYRGNSQHLDLSESLGLSRTPFMVVSWVLIRQNLNSEFYSDPCGPTS